ncbi:DEAD/DEAH box helicase family protein [Tsukamurella paurometabola]|uniref:Type I restriction enzyme EcoKI subunit R n=1 Tax=Tsukamurella paurometabola TaxID=2061 RepID=A0A3P8LGA6_TSUPA|nr:DEAD/DEAH box helicase family protein [Tsukamurella paurometabola]UEA83208.1 DEAD/DEAH box helicase family protein [Tsukamurella paurometabola]VDR40302.1 type I restriction enzyme EcoKI subunit R [Tsukamurella paurometabola]
MGNFDFVRTALPSVFGDCARAESYLVSDPRSACFYSRRAVEHLVHYLYDVNRIPTPYKDDLAARVGDAKFKAVVPQGIIQKLTLIRKVGNAAVHENRAVRPDHAIASLRELFHVVVWATFNQSSHPELAPTKAQFDPALAAQAAPLSRAEVAKLAEKFAQQDAVLAREREEKAGLQQELEELRAQVAAVQAAKQSTDDHDYDEAQTRDEFIDLLLEEAAWTIGTATGPGRVTTEVEVTGMPSPSGKGYVDYVLWGADGRPVGLVEAKRTNKSPDVGQQQAKLYADCLEARFGQRPVIFYSNGYEHWVWDDAGGYPPRPVQGFYTPDELGLMVQRRTTRKPLSTVTIDNHIAGRYYQTRAIKAVDGAFEQKNRQALLVMATGSGKTRTVIALVDQLMRANWVRRVLFLADRTALVRQAVNAFKANLPDATTVNLVTEKATDGRVYASTYPTMMNLINSVDDAGRRFGPGHFDLIVIDEAHRSVYAKYGAIFEYFDGLLVGLTATPKDEVDHNTYRLFHLEDGVPTDAYDLEDAIEDGYLVRGKNVPVGTKFMQQGIRYADLSDAEKEQWDSLDWGDDEIPDEVGAEELNRFLFNEDTVDKVLASLMTDGLKVAGGDRLGKTIIFAKNQAHAEYIQQRFDLQWPHYAGHFARVITHGSQYSESLIDDFTVADKAPHIAISVDMLDTGIDVPEIVNLVFFKTVRSKTKYMQMMGRGTRLCPDLFGPGQDKTEFLVFDFCGNDEYFGAGLPGSEGSKQKSLSQRLFEARLELVVQLKDAEPALRSSTVDTLNQYVAGMTTNNFLVRPHRKAVERYSERAAWEELPPEAQEAILTLAGLPSSVADADEKAKRFDLLVLRAQLASLEGDTATAERVRRAVQDIASSLLEKANIPAVQAQIELIEAVNEDEWWVDVTLPMLEAARIKLRSLAQLVDAVTRNRVYTDFEDELITRVATHLASSTPGINPERFKAKSSAYLLQHEDNVALQRLKRNRQLTPSDIEALEAMLVSAGASDVDIAWAREQAGGLGLFVRSLVGLDRAAAVEAFGKYLDESSHTVDQVRFVNMIIDELSTNGFVDPTRLWEDPYTDTAPGPDHVFPGDQVGEIVTILKQIKGTAAPEADAS